MTKDNLDIFSSLRKVINNELYDIVLNSNKNIALFGEADSVKLMVNILKNNNITIEHIFNYDIKKVEQDIKFLDMGTVKELKNIDKNTKCIIISPYYTEFYVQLKTVGFSDIWNFDCLSVSALHNYLEFMKYKEKIDKMVNSLNDNFSKKVVENILLARITGDYIFIDEIQDKNLDNEYFDKSIITLDNNETIIDAGAYIGDTLAKILTNTNFSFNKIYLFEPDDNNFKMLEKQVMNNLIVSNNSSKLKEINIKRFSHKIILNNSGVYSEKTTLNFKGNVRMASRVHDNGKYIIKVIKLDDFINIKEENITFIKMDIEGSEIEAIKGCENIISSQKPKLVICIYHKPDHLWEIPLLLKELVPEYDLYIRHYNSNLWDTVCYAIPK